MNETDGIDGLYQKTRGRCHAKMYKSTVLSRVVFTSAIPCKPEKKGKLRRIGIERF